MLHPSVSPAMPPRLRPGFRWRARLSTRSRHRRHRNRTAIALGSLPRRLRRPSCLRDPRASFGISRTVRPAKIIRNTPLRLLLRFYINHRLSWRRQGARRLTPLVSVGAALDLQGTATLPRLSRHVVSHRPRSRDRAGCRRGTRTATRAAGRPARATGGVQVHAPGRVYRVHIYIIVATVLLIYSNMQ